ncbi:hypothetical protein HAX54_003580 [Datura stramonium]|uniref:Uncharacterized protein n=1 Tax=Datura stramonium TaxID=4076 RepID=A0ABS8T5K7_DATST|nr:hypothetical protein [Datura stramonium]
MARVLMGGDFTFPTRYRMEAMKGIRKLRTEDKVLHFQWMANIIAEDKEGAEWVTGRKPIYKASLNFLAKNLGAGGQRKHYTSVLEPDLSAMHGV